MSDSRMYTAEVIADSMSPDGHRLTTVKAIYPHAVHKDMLRHRCMNRNVESFRAQPPEKLIESLLNGHAFMPDVFAKRTKGMGQSAAEISEQDVARAFWKAHIDNATWLASQFLRLGVAKQQVNFLLQDLCPLTEIITATDWTNFYALRTELKEDGTPVARPEVYKTAKAIQDAIEASSPVRLDYDQIHLPFVTEEELAELCAIRENSSPEGIAEAERHYIEVSAGRCARISYGDFEWWKEDPHAVSAPRARRLLSAGHMSPFEQQGRPFSETRWRLVRHLQREVRADETIIGDHESDDMQRQLEYSGNMHGWVPARKMFPNEQDYGLLREMTGVSNG